MPLKLQNVTTLGKLLMRFVVSSNGLCRCVNQSRTPFVSCFQSDLHFRLQRILQTNTGLIISDQNHSWDRSDKELFRDGSNLVFEECSTCRTSLGCIRHNRFEIGGACELFSAMQFHSFHPNPLWLGRINFPEPSDNLDLYI